MLEAFALLAALSSARTRADSVAEGPHCRVVCHFESPACAKAAIAIAEASWAQACDLFGKKDVTPNPLREIHLYPTVADYEAADARLTRGKFKANLSFSSWEEHSSHVFVQPLGAPEVLDAIGLPWLTEHLIAHESAHLAIYELAPNYRSHPQWFAEGAAEWIAVRALKTSKLMADPMDDPDHATDALRTIQLARDGKLTKPSALFEHDLPDLPQRAFYGTAWLDFELLMSPRYEKRTRKFVQEIVRLGGGDDFLARSAAAAKEVFGEKTVSELDEQFGKTVAALEPHWDESYRSLETLGTDWEQLAFAEGSNAIAWSRTPAPKSDFEVSGKLRILPIGKRQMNLLLRLDDQRFVSVAFKADSGVTVFDFDASKEAWNQRAFWKCDGLSAGSALDFSVSCAKQKLAVSLRGANVGEVELERPLEGHWGLGAQSGSAGIWSDVRVR